MAVRNTKAAQELIQKWQSEWTGMGLPLNIEVMELDLLSLDSVVRFSEMHYVGFVDTEDMNVVSGRRKFTSLLGHTSSKLAEVMFSSVFFKRLPAESGIKILCVSPGIVHTNVARDLPKIVQAAYHLIPYFIFSSQKGSKILIRMYDQEATARSCSRGAEKN